MLQHCESVTIRHFQVRDYEGGVRELCSIRILSLALQIPDGFITAHDCVNWAVDSNRSKTSFDQETIVRRVIHYENCLAVISPTFVNHDEMLPAGECAVKTGIRDWEQVVCGGGFEGGGFFVAATAAPCIKKPVWMRLGNGSSRSEDF